MRKLRLSLLLAAVLAGLAVLVVGGLNYSGFCLLKGRHLTESEIIDIGARDYFQGYPPPNYAPKDGEFVTVVHPIAYSSFEDFMSRNPNCCSVTQTGRSEAKPAVIHQLMGRFAGFVRIKYKLEDDVPGAPKENLIWLAVTNCGETWNGVYWGH